MNLNTWYGNSIEIPLYSHYNYSQFVASSLGIVRSIVQDTTGKSIHIAFRERVETALADRERGLILINSAFLKGRWGKGMVVPPSDTTITGILGIVVHEAAHFAYSPPSLEPWTTRLRNDTVAPWCMDVALPLSNILEDIYIEAEVKRQVPSIAWMLQGTNDIFFSEGLEKKVVGKVESITTNPSSLEEVSHVLNYLILAKTREKIEVNPFLTSLFNMALAVRKVSSLEERMVIGISLYNELLKDVPEEEVEALGKEIREALAKVGELLHKATAPHDDQDKEKIPEFLAGDSTQVDCYLRELRDTHLTWEGDEDGGPGTVLMERAMGEGRPIEADERYSALAEVARQRASVNRPYGMDRNRGTHIRKLYRIATDQKIFAESIPMSNYKPMQVVILMDCSGSMHGRKIYSASKATLGAAQALVEARCDVAVYGHSAYIYDKNDLALYRGKGFNEPVSILPTRLGHLLENPHEYLKENKDGYAIKRVGEKFYGSGKRKLLIVISDGAPACSGFYGGWAAIEHTKGEVEALRRKGIEVLSISIEESARTVNNNIYGEQWNTFNEDPNVIRDIVHTLLVK